MMPAGIIFMLCRISSWRYNQYTTFCLGLAIMESKVVLVTGSSGFLGSAICADLSRDHDVVGVDRREPSAALRRKAAAGQWHTLDIADQTAVTALFDHLAADCGTLHCVLHMAAFYHFGRYWLPEDDRVNVRGLRNILEGAVRLGTQRFLFAGSIASLPPPLAGSALSEKSSPVAATAYTRSKTIGEALLARYSDRMPTLALRIGGVFSDWCELPPLYSLMKLWSRSGLMGRMIPGRGLSGFPYIHRRDLVRCIRRILERQGSLAPSEILFASPPACTTHNELFAAIRSACDTHCDQKPFYVAPWLAKCFLFIKNRAKAVLGRKRYERRWMMDYVDKPLVVDTIYTQEKLQWTPGPELSILNRIPVLMRRFDEDRSTWERRNVSRNEGRYVYESDF
jgi:nucleoside-diphosphate-sugar epimerase